MPHVIVKLYPGHAEEKKARLAEAVTRAVMDTIGSREAAVSVAIEEVAPADWPEAVYRPDILDKPDTLHKRPGYNPFE